MARRAAAAASAGARASSGHASGACALLLAAALALLAAPRGAAAANRDPVFTPPWDPYVRSVSVTQRSQFGRGDFLMYATDPDGDALTFDITPVTPPARGLLELSADGSWAYEAEYKPGGASDMSPVNFTARILDGKGGSATATIILQPGGWQERSNGRQRAQRGARGGRGGGGGGPPRCGAPLQADAALLAAARPRCTTCSGRAGRAPLGTRQAGGCRQARVAPAARPAPAASRPRPRPACLVDPAAPTHPPTPPVVTDGKPHQTAEFRYTTPYATTLVTTPANRLLAYVRDGDSPALNFTVVPYPSYPGIPSWLDGVVGPLFGKLTSFDPATGDFVYEPTPRAGLMVGSLDLFYVSITDGTTTLTRDVVIDVGESPTRAPPPPYLCRCRAPARRPVAGAPRPPPPASNLRPAALPPARTQASPPP
jgi:hypothetical protein